MAKAIDMIMILLVFTDLVAMVCSLMRMFIQTVAIQGLLIGNGGHWRHLRGNSTRSGICGDRRGSQGIDQLAVLYMA